MLVLEANIFSQALILILKMEQSLFYRLLLVITGTSACSRVGSDTPTFPDASDFETEKGLFLNLGAPAQCQGVVTAWHMRYELDECNSRTRSRGRETFNSVFVVYRPVNNRIYEIVPGSIKSVLISCDNDETTRRSKGRYQEETIFLQMREQFMIQRGDVIAVCLPGIKRLRYRLRILENVRNEVGRNLGVYEYEGQRRDVEECNFNELQTIRSRRLSAESSYQLHLYAEIAGVTTPMWGDLPSISANLSTVSVDLQPLNDTQMLSDNQDFLKLVTAPSASVGGLIVLTATVLLVAGLVVCWSRKYKQRKSTSSLVAPDIDQRSHFTQSRGVPTTSAFDIKQNVAYHAYDFDEHVYAQPHSYSSTQHDYELNDYETTTPY